MKNIINVFIILTMAQAICFAGIGENQYEPYDAQTFAELCKTNKQEVLAKYGHHRVFVRGIVVRIEHPKWNTPYYPSIAFLTLMTNPSTTVEVTGVGYENLRAMFGKAIPLGVTVSATKIEDNTLWAKPRVRENEGWLPMIRLGDYVLVEAEVKPAPTGGVYLSVSVVRNGYTTKFYPQGN